MIKSLKKYQVQLTPFEATKNWALNNTDNENLLLMEDDYPVALEFLDFGSGVGVPVENFGCDIALEQQGTDLATIEEGLKVTGIFYPETDPSNIDGTYKRTIYSQVKTMFYNSYLDPTKIWGIDNIDFELSRTKRILADQFRLFNIPRMVFGDRMTPKSIVIQDNTLDNLYTITDDGNGNLFAGENLFSHQQELGEYVNEFDATMSSSLCDWYWAQNIETYTDATSLSIGFVSGQNENQVTYEYSSIGITFLTGSILDTVYILPITGSGVELVPLSLAFSGGYNTDTVITYTSSFDSSSVEISFISGTIFDTVQVVTASFDSSSVGIGFVTGSNDFTTYQVTMSLGEAFNAGLIFKTGSNN